MKKTVYGLVLLIFLTLSLSFSGCKLRKDKITISGSSSIVPIITKLAAEYEKDNDVRIIINMSSSGAGIADTQNGLNDFGLSSRELKSSEKGVTSQILCYDGIALIVGKNSKAENVTTTDVNTLFTKGVAIESQGISAGIGRDSGSGTRTAFDELLGIDGEYHPAISTLAETGNVIEAISPTTSSLGYISYGSLNDSIRSISLNGVSCTAENIKNKSYTLQRPFIVVLNETHNLSQTAQGFFDFIMSDSAKKIIENEHYIPF